MAYRMIHYTDFSQLDEGKAREVAKLFGMAGVVPSGNGGHIIDKFQGLSLVVAQNQSNDNIEGFMLIKCCDRSELEVRKMFNSVDAFAYSEYIKYARDLAQKSKTEKISIYARDTQLKKQCVKNGLWINQFSLEFDNEIIFKCYTDKTVNNIGRILAFLEDKVPSGRVYSYFVKYYNERQKDFIKYIEKETNLNVSTYLNSPRFFGALLICEEMKLAKLSLADLRMAIRNKKTNPSLYIEFKNKCPKTFEKYENDLRSLHNFIDAKNMVKMHNHHYAKAEEIHN